MTGMVSASTVAILGAGKSGTAIARQALAAGYRVRIASSGPAERTRMVTGIVTPGATATDIDKAADEADIVILATPLRALHRLPLQTLGGRIVIDVMNYWPPVDGTLPEFEDTARPSSLIVADTLPATARLVKTLNHIGYHEIEELARPTGHPDRIGLAVAGDDPDVVATVTGFVDDLGFDPVIAGRLATSAPLQPGAVIFGANLPAPQLREALHAQPSRVR